MIFIFNYAAASGWQSSYWKDEVALSTAVFEGEIVEAWHVEYDQRRHALLRVRLSRVLRGEVRSGELVLLEDDTEERRMWRWQSLEVGERVRVVGSDVIGGVTMWSPHFVQEEDWAEARGEAERASKGATLRGYDPASGHQVPMPPPPGKLELKLTVAGTRVHAVVKLTSAKWLPRTDGSELLPGRWTAEVQWGARSPLHDFVVRSGETTRRTVALPGGLVRLQARVAGTDEPLPYRLKLGSMEVSSGTVAMPVGVHELSGRGVLSQRVVVRDGQVNDVSVEVPLARVYVEEPGGSWRVKGDGGAWSGNGALSDWLPPGLYRVGCGGRDIYVDLRAGETALVGCP